MNRGLVFLAMMTMVLRRMMMIMRMLLIQHRVDLRGRAKMKVALFAVNMVLSMILLGLVPSLINFDRQCALLFVVDNK